LKTGKRDEAERLLDDLKRVKSYRSMEEQMDTIQRRAFSVDKGVVPPGVVKRIDSMLDITRKMMQKYLQDTMVRDLETELSKAK
jgi:hypothetical protein